ncbi:MAG: EcsC family protein [Methylocystis sp.]
MSGTDSDLTPGHRQELARAHKLLQNANFATRLTDYAGKPIHGMLMQMPKPLLRGVDRAVEQAVHECLKVALKSLKGEPKKRPSTRLAAALAGVAGGVGGLFGAAALPIELPMTTVLMLRAIADIARHHGEDLSTIEGRLSCVEVFAYGSCASLGVGAGSSAPRADVGYYASRAMLGRLANEASSLLLERGAANLAAPAVAALTGEVASRFGVVVWEKLAASAIPLAGAAGAATINVIFMNHFQSIARGHFTLRRLERIYGEEAIRTLYRELEADEQP